MQHTIKFPSINVKAIGSGLGEAAVFYSAMLQETAMIKLRKSFS